MICPEIFAKRLSELELAHVSQPSRRWGYDRLLYGVQHAKPYAVDHLYHHADKDLVRVLFTDRRLVELNSLELHVADELTIAMLGAPE